jgi:dipeptidyl aminopeptidase/acylaminoacyl peptidase
MCTGRFEGLWWFGDTELAFLKREGWGQRYTALYRWMPGLGAPQLVLRTDDLLERCRPAAERLLCIHESTTRPSHIVAIDLASGALSDVFDPNRGISARITSKVRRITWRTASGREVYGDLVLPPSDGRGAMLPTLVTLYHSRGFLRGGTGNEYPIFLFAQRGYAVLSIERPSLFAEQLPKLKTYDDIYAANVRDWSDLKNVQSAISAGVALLVSRGVADPQRLGITGLSAGAASVRFALINSRLFAAASLSSCCVDETSSILAGPAWEKYSRSVGYPPAFPVDTRFWRPGSLVLNAGSMSTPLLMQLADREALAGIPSLVALRQYRQPVELRVFPDEFHIKWQPVHRAAVYETNLDWFGFWLRNAIDPNPAKAEQYDRWKQLRADRTSKPPNPSTRP